MSHTHTHTQEELTDYNTELVSRRQKVAELEEVAKTARAASRAATKEFNKARDALLKYIMEFNRELPLFDGE